MVEICALASGSNGNCYYVGNESDAVLIDAGIYYNRLIERAEAAGVDIDKVRAVFISHEHTDHVSGAYGIAKRLCLPFYFTRKTFNNTRGQFRPADVRYFEPGDVCDVFGIKVHTFSKRHDASDPCSFVIETNGRKIGVMTDIGIVTEAVTDHFSQCDAVFLESNYDEDMLWHGSYPYYLKQRVASEVGHLSNNQSVELASNFASSNLSHIFLSHISAENNTIEKALMAFSQIAQNVTVLPTSRHAASEVVRL
ncbi:MAG: MBL fold metallo-hydrolase [Salinivirgaceae bacterium]|nr:MBL fold metallo-hydrolase [Salinivirgaceae bacterium]